MNWKFWKHSTADTAGGAVQGAKLEKPRDLPEPVGRKMVVDLKMDPDEVWALKYVGRPVTDRKKTSEFRIFNPARVNAAGVAVKNWTSLDDRTELILYTGIYDKNTGRVDIQQG